MQGADARASVLALWLATCSHLNAETAKGLLLHGTHRRSAHAASLADALAAAVCARMPVSRGVAHCTRCSGLAARHAACLHACLPASAQHLQAGQEPTPLALCRSSQRRLCGLLVQLCTPRNIPSATWHARVSTPQKGALSTPARHPQRHFVLGVQRFCRAAVLPSTKAVTTGTLTCCTWAPLGRWRQAGRLRGRTPRPSARSSQRLCRRSCLVAAQNRARDARRTFGGHGTGARAHRQLQPSSARRTPAVKGPCHASQRSLADLPVGALGL